MAVTVYASYQSAQYSERLSRVLLTRSVSFYIRIANESSTYYRHYSTVRTTLYTYDCIDCICEFYTDVQIAKATEYHRIQRPFIPFTYSIAELVTQFLFGTQKDLQCFFLFFGPFYQFTFQESKIRLFITVTK